MCGVCVECVECVWWVCVEYVWSVCGVCVVGVCGVCEVGVCGGCVECGVWSVGGVYEIENRNLNVEEYKTILKDRHKDNENMRM